MYHNKSPGGRTTGQNEPDSTDCDAKASHEQRRPTRHKAGKASRREAQPANEIKEGKTKLGA